MGLSKPDPPHPFYERKIELLTAELERTRKAQALCENIYAGKVEVEKQLRDKLEKLTKEVTRCYRDLRQANALLDRVEAVMREEEHWGLREILAGR